MSSRLQEKQRLRAKREERERERVLADRNRRRLRLLGVVAAAAAVIVVVAIVAGGGHGTKKVNLSRPPAGAARTAALFRGIPEQGTVLGDPKAPVTLAEFADLKCPVCRAFTLDEFPGLVNRYVRSGKVRVVMAIQDFVGNRDGDSERAARMALAAARQNRLWPFADLFYENQQDETSTYVSDAFLRHIGSGVRGLDVHKALSERSLPQVTRALRQSLAEFNAGGFNATPSFAVGRTGGVLQPLGSGLLPESQIAGAIDKLLHR